jgi:hypothetical protein
MCKRPQWANVKSLPAAFLCLLAFAGCRLRDIECIVAAMSVKVRRIDNVNHNVMAGINSKKQLTLCVAVLKIGVNFTFDPADDGENKALITSPFNVVLF